jgi:microspherule protein 1
MLETESMFRYFTHYGDTILTDMFLCFRHAKKEIRHLENELGRWQVLVDSVTGISPPDFDNQTLAVLRGRLVRYLMRSREVCNLTSWQ